MTRISLFICGLAILAPQPVLAQQTDKKVMPRITIVHPGSSALKADLKALLNLTNSKEKKQWKNVRGYLDEFSQGVNEGKPIRIDFMTERADLPKRISIPVTDIKAFRSGLEILGVESGRASGASRRDKNLYQLKDSYDGFMRYLGGYATFGSEKNDIAALVLKGVESDIAGIVARRFNLGAELVNTKLDEPSIQLRRNKFQDIRENARSALKKKSTETKAAFELRSALARHQMDEAERLMADIERLTVGLKFENDVKDAMVVLDLKPIANSELAKTMNEFSQIPDMFAAIKRADNSILSLRVNHPLDEMRRKNYAENWKLAVPETHERIDRNDTTDTEKKFAKELAAHTYNMLKQGSERGNVNGFIEVTRETDGKHIMLTGLNVPAECDLVGFLELIPKASAKQSLEKNVAKYGKTDIHKLTIKSRYDAEFQDFFGNDGVVWIGTSDSGLWMGVGKGAEKKLEEAIKLVEAKEPQDMGDIVNLFVHLRPWVDLVHRLETKLALPTDRRAKTRRQEARELRRRALEAMSDMDDTMTMKWAKVQGDRLESSTKVSTGVLRLLGKLLAKFSKETFEVN